MALVLGADVGGTNANFAIIDSQTWKIVYMERYNTQKVTDFSKLVNEFLITAKKKVKRTPTHGGFSIAGPVTGTPGNRKVKMTNSKLLISEVSITKRTPIKKPVLMNDYIALGWATNILKPNQKKILKKGKPAKNATRAIIGAGTGLGKGILINNGANYFPIPSEGGVAKMPCDTLDEFTLVESIKRNERDKEYVNLVNGKGIIRIYNYLRKTQYPSSPLLNAEEIAKQPNICSKKTMELFTRFYARTCKNFVLETLAVSGLYIAGGIAIKNPYLFDKKFFQEFTKHNRQNFHDILKNIPITLITDYTVSMVGAAYGAIKEKEGR